MTRSNRKRARAKSKGPKLPALSNRLIAAMDKRDRIPVLANSTEVELATEKVLYEPFTQMTDLYFPLNALISKLSITEEGDSVESAVVGNEGMFDAGALLEEPTMPYQGIVQANGRAIKVRLDAFKHLYLNSPSLLRLVNRYLHAIIVQVSQSNVCNRFHSIEQRLSRWLLVSLDRWHSPSFPYTQGFLAEMLGTDRVTVSLTAGVFKRAGIIEYSRGTVTILSREELEQITCECYWVVKAEYDRFLG